MRTSDTIDALATALALAQGEIRPAIKDALNPAFHSKYADLGAVFEAIRPALAKHGLSVVQMPEHSDDALLHLTTRICHKSGQWIEGTMSIPVGKVNAHGYGSAITYARRYALAAAVGVVSDEDDDGNAATQAPVRPITGRQVAQDEFDALPADAQAVVKEWADECTALVRGGDVRGAVELARTKCDTHEDELALASQLPSDVRNKMKAEKRALA